MSWIVLRNGQICPTKMPCPDRNTAIQTAIILARYDGASYAVAQPIYNVVPVGDTVEVHRTNNDRVIQRETFGALEGTRDEP